MNRNLHNEVIFNVYISPTKKCDIINFYNKFFIPSLKSFIVNLPNNFAKKENIEKGIISSSLQNIIPEEIKKSYNSMTPKTQLLYAFTESPLIKSELLSYSGNYSCKTLINFDDMEKVSAEKYLKNKFNFPMIDESQELEEKHQSNTFNI